jgi:glutamate-1-semialdehyde 2,1-aminomutase
VTDFQSARASDVRRYGSFFQGLLERGVYFAPSQFEACLVSMAHSGRDIDATVRGAYGALLRP